MSLFVRDLDYLAQSLLVRVTVQGPDMLCFVLSHAQCLKLFSCEPCIWETHLEGFLESLHVDGKHRSVPLPGKPVLLYTILNFSKNCNYVFLFSSGKSYYCPKA